MPTRVEASAPGKLIVFGEHAVVYGEPAFGVPLERCAHVALAAGRGLIRVRPALRAKKTAASPRSLVEAALGGLLRRVDVTIALEFPPMAGFGSSAALAVALLRAKAAWLGSSPASRGEILRAAIRVEDVAHGRASGVDPAIALYGEPIMFERRGRGVPRVERVRLLAPVYLVVGSCGGHGGARVAIGGVRALRETAKPLVVKTMAALGEITRTGTRALAAGDLELAGRAIDLSHGILSGFGLVGEEVEAAVRVARAAGALGAKMSGAGGVGGAFFALAAGRTGARRIARRLTDAGFRAWVEVLGAKSA